MFTGTVVKNRRELPETVRDKRFVVRSGETRSFRDGRVLVLAWRAETKKKPLLMMSSACSSKPVSVTSRRERVSSKPAVVNSYNHSMNSVDIADQLTVFYSFVRKTRKWWRKLFFYLLEVSVVNSYLLYKQAVDNPTNHLRYRRTIVEQVATLSVQQAPPRQGPGAPRRAAATHDGPQRLNKKPHFLRKAPAPRDCIVCSRSEEGWRRRTVYFCNTCTTHPHLCPDVCFERFHTLANYKL